jgi:NAD(P)-dependent dehydrogenase (short-subunit alcohol dehydrogenase family)
MDLNGKVAVITGGASGIGFALAKSCLERKIKVVIADTSQENIEASLEQLGLYNPDVMGIVCDVSNLDSITHAAKQTITHFKRVDWLFNNAGILGQLGPLWEVSNDDYKKILDINLFGIINGVKAFLPMLSKNSSSHIINLSSIFGFCSAPNLSPYVMTKHATIALSETLARDLHLAKSEVAVSVACPSFTNTKLIKHSPSKKENPLHAGIERMMEYGRSADDIAEKIIDGILKKQFYILPDSEVKTYCEQRMNSIINSQQLESNSLGKLINRICERARQVEHES